MAERPESDERPTPVGEEAVGARLAGLLLVRRAELSPETVAALDRLAPPAEPGPALRRRLRELSARAELDLRFEQEHASGRRSPSLGAYLVFLRTQAGLTAGEAARKLRIDLQLLGDLERDTLRPAQVPARKLAALVRRLQGTLEMTERLLQGLVRAPRQLARPAPGRLYRTRPGATPSEAAAASREARGEPVEWIDNPEYAEELEVVEELARKLREAW
ncbi:MAG: hypothetical protein ACK47B_13640 [Armatimonadota bacterium]